MRALTKIKRWLLDRIEDFDNAIASPGDACDRMQVDDVSPWLPQLKCAHGMPLVVKDRAGYLVCYEPEDAEEISEVFTILRRADHRGTRPLPPLPEGEPTLSEMIIEERERDRW